MSEREKFRQQVVGRTITDVRFGSHSEDCWETGDDDVTIVEIVLDHGETIYLDGSGLISDKAVFALVDQSDKEVLQERYP